MRQFLHLKIYRQLIMDTHMRTLIKNLIALTAVSFALCANTANATTLIVTVRNLSTEKILSSSSDFPDIAPSGNEERKFSFPESSSRFDVTFRTPSGKACRFQGSHRITGRLGPDFTKSATSVGKGNPYCHANLIVQKYTAPSKYYLNFNITD